ncbi:MAG: hypothetical protein EBR02_02760 [Alphaproteobacteria bacterium]|nr:hypothetical protein [Alphaproteobacteria bacterium]
MTDIHIEYDGIETFSAFKFARRIIEKAKDVAARDGAINVRMDGFSEAEANAVAGLVDFSVQQSPTRIGTVYGLRTDDVNADKVAIHLHDTKIDACEWNPGKQQMHISIKGNSLPAYAMQNKLNGLHHYLFSQTHPIHRGTGTTTIYQEILCESGANAEGLCKRIIIPLLESNRISFDFGKVFSLTPIQDSPQVYLQIDDQIFRQLRGREIGARGQSSTP